MKKKRIFIILGTLLTSVYCTSEHPSPPLIDPVKQPLAKGADISWITQMEAQGEVLYTTQGEIRECTQLMKELGMNAIRLRVWVDPAEGWNSKEDVLEKLYLAPTQTGCCNTYPRGTHPT